MNSPIRYFGSKGMFKNEIIKRFPKSETYDTYLEAYGGSASILFAIEPKPVEIYNDIEQNVYSLMKVLQDQNLFEQFKRLCDLTYHSRQLNEEYKQQLKKDELNIDRAFMFYYNTRTSFNGLGGYSCPTVVRRNMSKGVSDYLSSIDRLYDCHQRLSRVQIENMDAVKLLKKHDKENVFCYLDPPYTIDKQNDNNNYYKHNFGVEKQEEMIDQLLNAKSKILLSGYRNKIYEKLENSGWSVEDFEVKVTKQEKAETKIETLWFNYEKNI